MIILGINAYHGDVSAVLVRDGELIMAVEEERFRRVKHWAGFPSEAILNSLQTAGLNPDDVDHFAISRNTRANLLRKVAYAVWSRPRIGLVADRFRNRRRVLELDGTLASTLDLNRRHVRRRLHWIEHHPSHLASAFFVSPFDEAAVCAVDGFGDFVSTSLGLGRGARLEILNRVYFPHSLGLLYLAVTQYLGFPKYGDEYKVMGLAPYGTPTYVNELRRLVRLKPEGRFELNLPYFRHWVDGVNMTWDEGKPTIGSVFSEKLEELLGPARKHDEPLAERHEAIAASIQVIFEESLFHILNALYKKTGVRQLCLAGGCALNSVANGKIRENTPFEEIYIQPAAGDSGTALGAAYYLWHQILAKPRRFTMEHGYWGPEFKDSLLGRAIDERRHELDGLQCHVSQIGSEDELCRLVAKRIADGGVVGWFQGRMEWGPRALGNRCILADPRKHDMRDTINTKIKFREKFRPFAPSVLEEALDDYFVGAVPDPFMIQVYPVRPDKRDVIPAVTHVDGSGRLQTVSQAHNPLYWRLLKAFGKLTGVPILLNTSFNENEPIVYRPSEAIDCFLRTGLDMLVLGNYIVEKG